MTIIYLRETSRREFPRNPLVLTRTARKCSWFLSLGISDQYNFELSMEKIFELPLSLMYGNMVENFEPQWNISQKKFSNTSCCTYCISVFTLCHFCEKNFPRLSIYVYRFVFSLQGCTKIWLPACELDEFLCYEVTSISTYPRWDESR